MNFGALTASNWTLILPTLRKFCFLLHCQASQTEISKRNSTKLCQTVDGKHHKLNKIGEQKRLHLFGFLTNSTLNGEYLQNKT